MNTLTKETRYRDFFEPKSGTVIQLPENYLDAMKFVAGLIEWPEFLDAVAIEYPILIDELSALVTLNQGPARCLNSIVNQFAEITPGDMAYIFGQVNPGYLDYM